MIAQTVIQELEKEMSKAVGVHPMAIKDIVKDLREENLIEEEKIGASEVKTPKQIRSNTNSG